jgi:hypothetical protein
VTRAASWVAIATIAGCGTAPAPAVELRPGHLEGAAVVASLPEIDLAALPRSVSELVRAFDELSPEEARSRIAALAALEGTSGIVLAALRGLADERDAADGDGYARCAELAEEALLETWRAFCTARGARAAREAEEVDDGFLCLPASAGEANPALALVLDPVFAAPLDRAELELVARDVRRHLERSGRTFRAASPSCRPETGRRARVRIRCDLDARERCALEVVADGDRGVDVLRAEGPRRADDVRGWRAVVSALAPVEAAAPSPIPERTIRGEGFRIEHWIAFGRGSEVETRAALRAVLPGLAGCRAERSFSRAESSTWLVSGAVARVSPGDDACVRTALASLAGPGRLALVLTYDADRELPLVRSCGAEADDPALASGEWIDVALVRALADCAPAAARYRAEIVVAADGSAESVAIEPAEDCVREALAQVRFPCGSERRTLTTTIELVESRAADAHPR